jgi:cytochrome c553
MVVSAAAPADESGGGAFSPHGLQAKLDYCKACHGLSGEGYRGYFPMPRLAGQQPRYVENQLRAFIERRRTNPVMFNVARVLSPAMISALAEHFRGLNSRPVGGAPKEHMAPGKTIYDDGLAESNVPACTACHGPDAMGQGEIPRLAGQLFPYTVKVLTNWSKERGQGATDSSAIMVPTAHNLSQSQVAAIAAYLSDPK